MLEARARSRTAPYRVVVRAKIVLAAAEGVENRTIARRLDVCVDVVSRWRKRFSLEGVAGLEDRKRSGRPCRFSAEAVAAVKAMACEPPAGRDVPLARWSSGELAAQAVAEGVADSLSAATVRRWLAADVIKPWRHRSWIFPRDPDFAAKAARVLDLYARVFEDQPLGPDDYVISADEKSQLQALSPKHPGVAGGPGRLRRVEFEYERHGTLAYLAAYDVHRARLMGRVAPTTGIEPFMALVERVMTAEPYASARRVFWVVDNGSSHAGATSVARMREKWPTATLVHLPVHASWLNQIEIVFSVIQRKVVKPADFADLTALAARLMAFEPRYNTTARPFDWRFDRAALADLLARIDAHRSPPLEAPLGGLKPPGHHGLMAPKLPESTKTSLTQRVNAHARTRWPHVEEITVRFRGNFAYLAARLPGGPTVPLCRLRYAGMAHTWGFAFYRASHDDYQDSFLPTGTMGGSPEEALDCAGDVYLTNLGLRTDQPDTPTN